MDMGKGIDSLVGKFTQLTTLATKFENAMTKAGKAVGGSAGAVNRAIGAGQKGLTSTGNFLAESMSQMPAAAGRAMDAGRRAQDSVQTGTARAGNFLSGSMGSMASNRNFKEGRMGDDPEKDKTIRDVTGGTTRKIANKLGLGEVQVNNRTAAVDLANGQRIEQARTGVAKAFGVDLAKFEGLSKYGEAGAGMQQIASASFYGPKDAIDLATGVASGFANFMPNVGQSLNTAAGYYNANVSGGMKMGRRKLQDLTYGAMSGGMTSIGSDAAVAQLLGGRGMVASQDVYKQTLNSVSNAARYMNIENSAAASSIESLTSGKGAGNMLKSFGIYTADLKTGKEKSQTQIFEELAQRLTAGRKTATTEQTQMSIRRGALGATINSFFQGDEAGAQMFKQYMIDRAGNGGVGKDFGDSIKQGLDSERNPLNAQMTMNASDTRTQAMAQDNYIKGIEAATGMLQALNVAAGGLATTFAGLPNAMGQTLMAHNTTKGLVGGLSTITGFASKGVSGITQALMNMDIDSAPAALATSAMIAGSMAAATVPTLAGMAGAAIMGGVGLMSGGDIKTVNGLVASGGTGGGGVGGDNSTGSSFQLPNSGVTQGFSNTHDGVDYNTNFNEPVKAIADGQVIVAMQKYPERNAATAYLSVTKDGSWGNYVQISHAGGYMSTYAHLNKVKDGIRGKQVKKGDVIGYAGNSGWTKNSSGQQADKQNPMRGVHLHLELYKGSQALDPRTVGNISAAGNTPTGSTTLTGSPSASGASVVSSISNYASGTTSGDTATIGNIIKNSVNSATSGSGVNITRNVSLIQGLFSGDESKIRAAMKGLTSTLGISGSDFDYYSSRGANSLTPVATYTPTAALAAGAPGYSPVTGSNPSADVGESVPTKNVNITINIPEVSESEAQKFAKLVKQFLENDTFMSNTGSI